MALPLYQELQNCQELAHLKDREHATGHAGLWFERFYDRYQHDFTDTKDGEGAFLSWLKDFQHKAGDADMLDAALERQMMLVAGLGGDSAVFKSSWHYVSGMGYPHPLENGFNWHPVWGVPYLPASGLKGLVRSWVEAWEFADDNTEEQQAKQKCLLDWFGSVSKDPDDSAAHTGKVIFFDAIPLRPVMLTTDIMTPHMGDWYAKGGDIRDVNRDADKIPADWHSPNPIYFLSAKEPAFMVSVAPRNALVADDVDMTLVMQCVSDALEWLGAGAKTAVGYGQFERDDEWTAQRKEKQQQQLEQQKTEQQQAAALSGLSGVARELIQFSQHENWEDKNAFLRIGENDIESWLEKLAEEPDPAAVGHLRELFELHFAKPSLLSDPGATAGKKNKPVFKPRARALGERFLEIEKSVQE